MILRVQVLHTPPDPVSRPLDGRRTLSRRRFVGRTAGAAGAALGAWLWVPLLSQAQTIPPPKKPAAALAEAAATPIPKPQARQAPAGQGLQMFLEFPQPLPGATDPLVGESTGAAHPRTVELISASLGIKNPTNIGAAAGGAVAGRAAFEALRIVKNVDATSPTLLTVAGQGVAFPQLNVYVRRAGDEDDLLAYRFKLALVTAIATASSDDSPQETVDFVFGAMDITYPGAPTGDEPGTAAWSVVTNQPELDVGP
jgi:type VI protein secretion system component Hcp